MADVDAIAGVFLSQSTLVRLNSLFNIYAEDGKEAVFREASKEFTNAASEDPNYDSFYTCLYVASLTRDNRVVVRREPNTGKLHQLFSLEILSELVIENGRGANNFDDSLIDEYIVADIFRLRANIVKSIPIKMLLTELELGCVLMQFCAYGLGDERREERERLCEHVRRTFEETAYWKQVFKRFRVEDYSLSATI